MDFSQMDPNVVREVAWFLIQLSPLRQLHFQGLSTTRGHFYR
jgi:hypothetical protein